MPDRGAFEGGCLCGRVRYAADAEPLDAGYCHCRMCQRSSGAPVLMWVSFPTAAFRYLKEAPSVYHSSAKGSREFCPSCGAQIAFRESGASTLDVNAGCLDRPEAVEPRSHTWTASRIPWFDTKDALPRFEDAGPEGASG